MNGAAIGIDVGTTGIRAAYSNDGNVRLVSSRPIADELDIPSVLTALREDAETAIEDIVSSCVIALSTKTPSAQRDIMLSAANSAGFEEVRLTDGAVAVAAALGREGRLLLLDFGAKAKLSVVEGGGNEWQVLESVEENCGIGFDTAIADWLKERALLHDMKDDAQRRGVLIREAEKVRTALSGCAASRWTTPPEACGLPELTVEREDIERLIRFPVRSVVHMAYRMWKIHRPDRVFITGGASRTPLLQEAVSLEIPDNRRIVLGPEETVARGAALLAANSRKEGNRRQDLREIRSMFDGFEGILTRQQQERLNLILSRAGSAYGDPAIIELIEGLARDLKRTAA